MNFFSKRKATAVSSPPVQTAPPRSAALARPADPFPFDPIAQRRLFQSLRYTVPVIDAAIHKLTRLIGGFSVECDDPAAQEPLAAFFRTVKVNRFQSGIHAFLSSYFDQLLTFGTAVGEIVLSPDASSIAALYNVPLDDVLFSEQDSPLVSSVCRKSPEGLPLPLPFPDLVVTCALHPPHGRAFGVSILNGLPFVSDVLMKIYHAIGLNWERMGNLRFAVTYQPPSDSLDQACATERAQQIASEWAKAMQPGHGVSDFVAVGDVSIKVIGADNQILDSQVPVRQMLEQIVAKLGVPPFLLGLTWSSTERMSSQQADILTSEIDAYRRILTPVLERVCRLWLTLNHFPSGFRICWENITLQDEVDLADARLKNAQAAQIEALLPLKEVPPAL